MPLPNDVIQSGATYEQEADVTIEPSAATRDDTTNEQEADVTIELSAITRDEADQ